MSAEPGTRPLRRACVVMNDGRSTSESRVFCLRLEQSVAATDCTECTHGGPIRRDEARDREVVECRFTPSHPPLRVVIGEHMSDGAICVRDTLDVARLRSLLRAEGITGVPVVDAEGRPIGVVSRSDLVYHRHGTVADVMTKDVLALSERASLFEAAALMAYEGVHRVVVIDDDGRVVGVVSALDVAAWVARAHGYVIPPSPWATKIHHTAQGGF